MAAPARFDGARSRAGDNADARSKNEYLKVLVKHGSVGAVASARARQHATARTAGELPTVALNGVDHGAATTAGIRKRGLDSSSRMTARIWAKIAGAAAIAL